ncbi:hypothetical protein GQ600_11647 [Phytophthora cactorum]|nr:hypothetical protein GQ600_11647 [Phytophthora cactorum]
MDQRWRFLRPWCTALQGRIVLVCDRVVWETQQRYLRVTSVWKHEKSYIAHFHKVREALLLLAVVAHVDPKAWKYLLSRYCKLNFGNEGEEGFTVEVPVEFGLCVHKYAVVNDKGEFDSDLAKFCGTSRYEHPPKNFGSFVENFGFRCHYSS